MIGTRKVAGMILLLVPAVFIYGCGESGNAGKQPSMEGTAAAAPSPDGITFTATEKDAFNPGNKIESARKTRLTAFGAYRGAALTETPTIEAAAAVINPPNMVNLKVGRFENEILSISSFPFDYENDIASLKSLFALHNLDRVVRGDMTEMEKFAALCTYTYRFLAGGKLPGPDTITGPSAFLITRNMREKGIGGTSEVYAALMCQLVLSCGHTARIVSMHTLDIGTPNYATHNSGTPEKGTPICHDICEAYVNALGKWVAFDPFTRAVYYTRETVPVSALELHTLAAENRFREVTPVCGAGNATDMVAVRESVLPCYRYLYLWRMNDILGKSPRNGSIPWQALYNTHLVWEDRYAPVSQGGFDKLDKFSQGGVRYVTHTRSDFSWNLNVANITVERTGEVSVKMIFNTITPNFDHFNLRVSDKPTRTGNVYELKDIISSSHVIISSVNAFGVTGRSSMAEFMQ